VKRFAPSPFLQRLLNKAQNSSSLQIFFVLIPTLFSARPALSRLTLLALTALWISLLPNLGPLRQVAGATAAGSGLSWIAFVVGWWFVIFTVTFLALLLFGAVFWRQSIRWLCAVAMVSAAALGFFTFALGMRFERTMFANLIQTNSSEARELITPYLIVWMLFVGFAPAYFALRVKVRSERAWRKQFAAIVGGLIVVLAAFAFPQYQRYASAARSKSITLETVAPVNFIGAAIGHWHAMRKVSLIRAPIDSNPRAGITRKQPRLVVFVLGETARAQNHSLNGYARETNPRLKALNLAYFPDSEACGTATTIAVPCIFSGLGRENFSMLKAMERQTLVDLVKKTGINVLWRENDGGCKDVCGAAEFEDFSDATHDTLCNDLGSCYDELMLIGLEEKLRARTGDIFLVLHLKGSHGPAYYKRYPKAFEKFTPACNTSELQQCSKEELTNAYDNTILYTDHILAETIAMLQRLSNKFAPALIYASDHGESLGENGLYLHGLPYAIAPDLQTKVPMLAWLSPQFLELDNWPADCMARIAGKPSSHDAIFSSLLGLLSIESTAYTAQQDMFSACTSAQPKKETSSNVVTK
jgi:lipid A ethanolaminephosphotransferase